MADPIEVMAEARKRMRDGRVQEADNLITEYFTAEAAAGAEAAAKQLEPEKPREPKVVLTDILAELIALGGNKDSLLRLLDELRKVS